MKGNAAMRSVIACVLLFGAIASVKAAEVPAVTNLRAEYRYGQVFLTWKETAAPEEATFNVYLSEKPLTTGNLGQAKLVCQYINRQSAHNWWLNPENFTRGKPKPDKKTGKVPVDPFEGFVIKEGGKPLDPKGGLHVHTVAPNEEGPRYYAVTCVINAKEDRTVGPGQNALKAPVVQKRAPIRPIWLGKGKAPVPGSAAGKPVLLALHAKGRSRPQHYLVFGDASHGWREGLAFKFDVRLRKNRLDVRPSDSMWLGRVFERQWRTRVIWTWWYGCSNQIFHPDRVKTGTPTNYTERRLLWILDWVRGYYKTDPNRVYCYGGSMGGCGTMAVAFHNPKVFAAVCAHVPNFKYDEGNPKRKWRSNYSRMIRYCGPFSLKTSQGMTLKERLDSPAFVRRHPGDLPFVFAANGRNDRSMTWQHNPGFYRAMQEGRHGFVAVWNDGTHGGTYKKLPAEFRKLRGFAGVSRFALNKSYPAFSNCSMDGDPGNGDKDNGTINGDINLGLDWTDPKDEAKRYEVLVKSTREMPAGGVTVDITPRRVQAFRLKPGESCNAVNLDAGGKEIQRAEIKADKHGLFTFTGFRITSEKGNRLVLAR